MPRAIIVRSLNDGSGSQKPDQYADRVAKYIPGDVVAAWIAICTVLRGVTPRPPALALWSIFVVLVILCGLWSFREIAKTGPEVARRQAMVSTASFVVWVYALGGPFPDWLGLYLPYIGSIILIVFTLAIGMLPPSWLEA